MNAHSTFKATIPIDQIAQTDQIIQTTQSPQTAPNTFSTLRHLSNEELDLSLKSLVRKEREVLSEILLHISEIDRRQLYLKLSYGSLFDYLTRHLNYSAGSAQRRIDAVRLNQEVPSLIQDLEKGDLNLSQVNLLQKSLRQIHLNHSHIKASQDAKISKETKSELLNELKHKSYAQSQVLISQKLNLEIKPSCKISHQADESVRMEMTLSKQQWQKLEQMKALLSHSLPNGSGDWNQVLEYVAEKVIQSKTKVRQAKIPTQSQIKAAPKTAKGLGVTAGLEADAGVEAAEAKNRTELKNTLKEERKEKAQDQSQKPSLYTLRKLVLQRDRCCQYQDKVSKRKCASTWQLQVDHIQPRWAGGGDSLDNLQVLCARHNRERYREQAHIRRR